MSWIAPLLKYVGWKSRSRSGPVFPSLDQILATSASRNFTVDPASLDTAFLDQLRSDLRASAGDGSLDRHLETLHRFEFFAAPVFRFPRVIWKLMRREIEDSDDLWPVVESGTFSADLLTAARHMRLAVPDFEPVRSVLAQVDHMTEDDLRAFPAAVLIELSLMSYSETRMPLTERLTMFALNSDTFVRADTLFEHYQDCLFDLAFDAVFHNRETEFVTHPAKVIRVLEKLAETRIGQLVLGAGRKSAHGFQGQILAMQGALEQSFPHFESVRSQPGFLSTASDGNALVFDDRQDKQFDQAEIRRWWQSLIQLDHHFRYPCQDGHAVLVAADAVYFKSFAHRYLHLLQKVHPAGLVHFHLLNPWADVSELEATFNTWEAETGLRINFTIETNQIVSQMSKHTGGMAMNVRHLALRQYLDHYSSLTLTDIDGTVSEPLTCVADFEGADLILHDLTWLNHGGAYFRPPYSAVMGGVMSVRSTDAAKRYLDRVECYIARSMAYCLSEDRRIVYPDQIAHFVCARMAQKEKALRVKLSPVSFESDRSLKAYDRLSGKLAAMQDLTDRPNH